MQNRQLREKRQLRGWSQDDLVRELVGLGIELGERQLGVSASLPDSALIGVHCRLVKLFTEERRSPHRVRGGNRRDLAVRVVPQVHRVLGLP